MLRTFLAVALLIGFSVASEAAPPASSRVVAGATGARRYWLSEDLNRLVFWKAPPSSQDSARH